MLTHRNQEKVQGSEDIMTPTITYQLVYKNINTSTISPIRLKEKVQESEDIMMTSTIMYQLIYKNTDASTIYQYD